jgi:hypothetical protein
VRGAAGAASPARVVYACGAILAAGFGVLLWRIPVQVADCINNIAAAYTQSWGDLVAGGFGTQAYLRPMIRPPIKLVLDLAPGYEAAAFRGLHVAQVFAAIALFVRALRLRTWAQACGALAALTVLTGSHTFATLIREGYPINTYLTVALCALVAVNIATEPESRWWTDAVVVFSFLVAVGTIESGLLVWVIVAAAAIAGCRGVSRGGLATVTALVAGYFVLRFLVLDVGMPNLLERSSGFGLARLEPPQLVERFGDNPWPLYAYNVASAASTVLFNEPRDGVFVLGRAWIEGAVRPWMVLDVIAAAVATMLIAWFAARFAWRRRPGEWTDAQRLLFIAAGVVAANAVISYPYAKDQVMSVAGIFVALATAGSIGALIEVPPRHRAARFAAILLVATAASLWSLRVVGQQHALVHTAFVTRNDWATVDALELHERFGSSPGLVALLTTLRARALAADPPYLHVWESRVVQDWLAH